MGREAAAYGTVARSRSPRGDSRWTPDPPGLMLAGMSTHTTPSAAPAIPTAATIVATAGLHRRYGEGAAAVDALAGVDVAIRRGELTAIMGASGSGKSTLMHCMAGL